MNLWWICFVLAGTWKVLLSQDADQVISPIHSQTGLYFDAIGQVSFSSTTWKIVTYVPLEPLRNLWQQVKSHQTRIIDNCAKLKNETWYHLTDCQAFPAYIRGRQKYVDGLKDVIADYLKPAAHRRRRGLIDFGGDILKFLFGTVTQSDAKRYNEHIKSLESEQQEFLRITKEQLTVLKSSIRSFNLTMQKVNKNEQVLVNAIQKLDNKLEMKIREDEHKMNIVLLLNENILQIQRGIDECQHHFEILVDAFLHAEDGIIQPQLITISKVQEILKRESPPAELVFPLLPISQLSRIITPVIYSQDSYLVYVLSVPLIQSKSYQLYKVLPFPVKQEESVFMYVEPQKDYILMDSLRQQYVKMSSIDLMACETPNEFLYICKESLPIQTYVPNADCESTLLHPSTQIVPNVCVKRVLTLSNVYWIPLHLSNDWLFVAPKEEIFTTLCPDRKSNSFMLKGRGKLTLRPRCKGYSTHSTLYAMSTHNVNNSKDNDVLPIAPLDWDCCLIISDKDAFKNLNLEVPLENILSSVDDLNLVSAKIEDIETIVRNEEKKKLEYFQVSLGTWASVLISFVILITCICCSCCFCKCCRHIGFWIWDHWTPRECLKQTQERFCIINNVGSQAGQVLYTPAKTSPTPSRESITTPCIQFTETTEAQPKERRSQRLLAKQTER